MGDGALRRLTIVSVPRLSTSDSTWLIRCTDFGRRSISTSVHFAWTSTATVIGSFVVAPGDVFLVSASVEAERLTEEFAANLLSWAHSGFSVYPASRVDALDLDGLEPCPPVGRRSRTTSARAGAARERRTARYVTRPALASGAVSIRDDGRVEVSTPPDPATGSASVTMDALDFVHAVVTQIPDARRHLVRYYGAYSHRRRAAVRERNGVAGALASAGSPDAVAPEPAAVAPEPVTPAEPGSAEARRRSAWARLLKRVFEVDPLRCLRAGAR